MYRIIDNDGFFHKKGLKLKTTSDINNAGVWKTLENANSHIKQSVLLALSNETLDIHILESLAKSWFFDCDSGIKSPVKPMLIHFLIRVREKMVDGYYHKDLTRFNDMFMTFLKS